MAVNAVNSVNAAYESVSFTAEITKTETSAVAISAKKGTGDSKKLEDTAAAVYEKSADAGEASKTKGKVDLATIEKLKADAEQRTAQLRGIVEKLLLKQGGTVMLANGELPTEKLAEFYRGLEVDEETQLQAQKDIAEDGYWGVEQTSDRLVDFAKALAGEDPEAAKNMLEAIKEGYKQASDAWGEDLPQISKDTLEATEKKMNEWIKSLGGDTESSQGTSLEYAAVKQTTTTVKVSASYTRAAASYKQSQSDEAVTGA